MKTKNPLLITLIFTGILISCGNSRDLSTEALMPAFGLGDTIHLAVNDMTICDDDLNLFIQFDTLYSDSRCPIDAQCIWEGNAELGLAVTYDKQLYSIKLNTHDSMQRDTTVEGYKIEVIGLDPYPGTPNTDGKSKTAHIIVSK